MIFAYPHATVDHVVDGDTLWAVIDLGLRMSVRVKVRVRGINAPELKAKPAGPDAAMFLAEQLPAGTPVALVAHSWTYDRIECDVMRGSVDIATLMVTAGQAVSQAR